MAKPIPKPFSKEDKGGPLGGIFMMVGAIVGYVYFLALANNFWIGMIGFGLGAFLGRIIEDIVFRLILIALTIVMIIGRQMFFSAIFDSAVLFEQPTNPPPYVQIKERENA